jgi:hypothetical protein
MLDDSRPSHHSRSSLRLSTPLNSSVARLLRASLRHQYVALLRFALHHPSLILRVHPSQASLSRASSFRSQTTLVGSVHTSYDKVELGEDLESQPLANNGADWPVEGQTEKKKGKWAYLVANWRDVLVSHFCACHSNAERVFIIATPCRCDVLLGSQWLVLWSGLSFVSLSLQSPVTGMS